MELTDGHKATIRQYWNNGVDVDTIAGWMRCPPAVVRAAVLERVRVDNGNPREDRRRELEDDTARVLAAAKRSPHMAAPALALAVGLPVATVDAILRKARHPRAGTRPAYQNGPKGKPRPRAHA